MLAFATTALHWFTLGLAGCLLYLAVARWAWRRLHALLPPQRQRATPWTAFEILAAVFFIYIFWPRIVLEVLDWSGLCEHLYGTDLVGAARAGNADAALRINLPVTAGAFLLQAVTIPLVFRAVSDTRPYQLGLTTHRLRQNAALGLLGWMLLTPLVLSFFALVQLALSWLTGESGKEHGLTQLSRAHPQMWEIALIVFVAVVWAPVIEELFFRGALQPFLCRHRWVGHGAVALAGFLALPTSLDPVRKAFEGNSSALCQVLLPLVFFLIALALYGVVCWRSATAVGPGIYATALLFALIHQSAWPAPVALLPLGVGLGWLAQRTQSLVPAMVLHALFNAVACVQMFLDV